MRNSYLKLLIPGVVLIGALMACGASTSAKQRSSSQTRDFQQTVDFKSGGTVDIQGHNGEIVVTSWDKSQVNVQARIRVKNVRGDEAAAALDNVEIIVEKHGNRIEIRFDHPWRNGSFSLFGGRKPSITVDFEVQVPTRTNSVLNNHNGSITARDLIGHMQARAQNGDIHLENITGDINVTDHNGDIVLRGVIGDVTGSTHNGSFTAIDHEGAVTGSSHNGRLKLSNQRGAVEWESHNGSIAIDLASVSPDDNIRLKSGNGGVRLRLNPDIRADIDIESHNGSINTSLPITIIGKLKKNRLSGTLNGGGATISVSTHNGSVEIRSRTGQS